MSDKYGMRGTLSQRELKQHINSIACIYEADCSPTEWQLDTFFKRLSHRSDEHFYIVLSLAYARLRAVCSVEELTTFVLHDSSQVAIRTALIFENYRRINMALDTLKALYPLCWEKV